MTKLRKNALELESLNDRIVPTVVIEQMGTTVFITGDNRANDIQISDDGTAAGLTVDAGNVHFDTTRPVISVVVEAKGGKDTVSYNLTGDLVGTFRTVQVFLGNGNDTFTADLGHSIDAASVFGLRVLGENGKDSISVDASGNVAGSLNVSFEGGNGMDSLSFHFDGEVTGVVRAVADGGNGKDTIDVAVNATEASTGNVFAQVLGGNGKDTLGLSVVGAGLTVDATVDGGRGHDIFDPSITSNVTVVDPK